MQSTGMKQDTSDMKRKVILRAALKIFGGKGYHYATLSQIASEAGVSRGLIHFYFENKLDLLVSLMLVFLEKLNSTHQQVLSREKDPVNKLRLYFAVFNDIILNDDDSLYWGNILKEGLPQDQVVKNERLLDKYEKIAEENKKLMSTIVDIIKQAQTEGLIDNSISPQILSLMFGGSSQLLYYGLFLQRTRSPVVASADTIQERQIKTAIETMITKFLA
jgi:TetR/AcrR family transcriptional regulator, fatty acid metabolism regulator protein